MIRSVDKYAVQMVPIDSIKPSPENDDIYGKIEMDDQMENLIDSIDRLGIEEPPIVTADGFILSGHRRYFAAEYLGYDEIPVRFRHDIRRDGNAGFHRELAEYNPQRIKSVGSLLKESLLRDTGADTYAAIEQRRRSALEVDAEYMAVQGHKNVDPITDKKREFLDATKTVIEDMRDYWPLSIRQIHYNLLNDPPLKQTPKRSKFDREEYRYRNDKPSYNALVRLLKSARYLGEISMTCIDDPTRPQIMFDGFESVDQFVQQELRRFLCGYHRDRQQGQARHVEVFGEKNTLATILRRACQEYYTPLVIGRGFCTTPVWRDIATRFRQSGKERMTLIIVSDYDPEGLSLADDAIRTLTDLWDIPVDGHRIAVTPEQVEELGLAEDFNPAKTVSSRFKEFVERTGDTKTWEVEALSPDYLVTQVRAAIEANLDMEVFNEVCDQERRDCNQLAEVRSAIAGQLQLG